MKKTYTPEQKSKRRRRRVIFFVTLLLIIAVFVVALGIYNCWWVYNDETHPIHIERKLKEKYICIPFVMSICMRTNRLLLQKRPPISSCLSKYGLQEKAIVNMCTMQVEIIKERYLQKPI